MSERFLIPGIGATKDDYNKPGITDVEAVHRIRKIKPNTLTAYYMNTTVLTICEIEDGRLFACFIGHKARNSAANTSNICTLNTLSFFESKDTLFGWQDMSKGRIPISKVDDPDGDEDEAIIYATGKDGALYALEIDCDDALNIALDIARSVSIIGSIDLKAGWQKL